MQLISKKKQNYTKSFSLLELSISLTIISTLLISGFSMLNGQNSGNKLKDTEKRMKLIEQAIASFVSIYDRLPCPANITLKDNDINSGLEYCDNTATTFVSNFQNNLPMINNNVFHTTDLSSIFPTVSFSSTSTTPTNYNVKFGTIPYNTLGLPKAYVADGWGNNFVYAVTMAMAATVTGTGTNYGSAGGLTPNYLENTNMGLLQVQDSTNNTRTNNAAYVLMSVGANGYGGYPRSSGTRNKTPTDTHELINHHALCSTGQAPNGYQCGQFAALEITETYDDIVHFRQKWQLVKEAGAVLSNDTCTKVANQIKTKDINVTNYNFSALCDQMPLDPSCAVFGNIFMYKIRELCLNQF